MRLILASSSPVRRELLTRAGVPHEAIPARVDEEAIRAALEAEGVGPRDMADALAEAKARKIAERHPEAWVLGSDQVLELDGKGLGKAQDRAEARAQLLALRGETHRLHSAAVIYERSKPVWRKITTAKLTMRPFAESFLDGYLDRNWESVRACVGAYKVEEEGIRLFQRIEGDYFTVLGLPLIEVLDYLTLRGVIEG